MKSAFGRRRLAEKAGGAERDRTADLLIANEALSQLSYGPKSEAQRVLGSSRGYSGGHLGPPPRPVNKPGWWPAAGCSGRPARLHVSYRSNRRMGPMKALFIVINYALTFYIYLLIAAAVLSWLIAFNVVNIRNQFVAMVADFLYRITEPALRPIRNFMPNLGGIDISPVILIFIIIFIQLIIGMYIIPNVP
jgi:YggT family protein